MKASSTTTTAKGADISQFFLFFKLVDLTLEIETTFYLSRIPSCLTITVANPIATDANATSSAPTPSLRRTSGTTKGANTQTFAEHERINMMVYLTPITRTD